MTLCSEFSYALSIISVSMWYEMYHVAVEHASISAVKHGWVGQGLLSLNC